MTQQQALERLAAYESTTFALGHASGILYYDGATVAPRGSAGVRASTLGELSRLGYELTTAPETVEMLETLRTAEGLDAMTARKVAELWRDYDRTRRIPVDLFVAHSTLCAEAESVWEEAKQNDDFAAFSPYLQRIFDSTREIAKCTDPDRPTYDALLDQYERGLDTATCDAFFATLREGLVPLIARVGEAEQIDASPLRGHFPVEAQRRFSAALMDILRLDRRYCIIGETEHPFTTNFSRNDVRITTHYHEDDLASSLYSVVHEGGHALYELHIDPALTGSPLGTGVSMAIHESQSRFYENILGRSLPFCAVMLPQLRALFPETFAGIDETALWRMVNRAEPSLIRTEADELTYALHIMVRYELERRMISGDITAADLPAAWREAYRRYLGVAPETDREGVLQDSHWAGGAIGYFPSYAIGSAYGAQYRVELAKSLDIDAVVRTGDLTPINDWFETRIWQHGCMIDPGALFAQVCGSFDPQVYVRYLEEKFSAVYGLR